MSNVPADIAARIAEIRAQMGMAPSAGGDAAPAAAAPDAAPAAPAGGGEGGDMAARIAAIKAKMAGGAAPAAAAPAASAPAKAAPAAAAKGDGQGGQDVQARIAALKAKMEAGRAAPAVTGKAKTSPKRAPPPDLGAAKAKNVFPVQPVDRTSFGGERLYGATTLHKWFALAAVLLTVTTLLMWKRDWDRDWKNIQRRQRELEIQRLEAQIEKADEAIDSAALERAKAELAAAEEALAAREAQLEALTAERLELEAVAYRTNQEFQFAKSEFDAFRYAYEEQRLSHGDAKDVLQASEEQLQALQKDMDEKQLAADEASMALQAKKMEIAALEDAVSSSSKEIAELTADRTLLESRLSKIDRGIFNDYIRNAPLVDMLQPTLKIDQIVLDKLSDNYNFMFVGKVDRCTTCHVNMANAAFSDWDPKNEDGEMVFNAHPRLDLFVSDSSPHPMGQFGCTVCHQGRGQAVEFPRTFHIPAADEWEGGETAEEKEARWVEEYDYDPDRHYWDWPMVPQDKIYSSCWQCHQETARLPGVPEYNESRALFEDYGCYGCHKVQGFEDYRKVGPDLTHMTAKLDEEWTGKWVMDPKGFRPTTKMPHFWNLSNKGANPEELAEMGYDPDIPWNNNSDRYVDDYRARNDVEARAITAYIFHRSEQVQDEVPYIMDPVPEGPGDPERGRELFESRGCLGCHSMESEGWAEAWHGPELSAVGSKSNPQWLYNWLRDPKKYYPTTVMPDLRLSEDEAWDITAYLMEQRDESWEEQPGPAADEAILDGIAAEYLASLSSAAVAVEQVATMRREQGGDAVELYVGEKLFNHYGCAGCHLVPEHYEDSGIGTELTYEGLKEVAKFDFGFEGSYENPDHIPHTRHDWFRAKLKDTRVFDRMPVIADGEIVRYDMKVKRPADKLKMPNFFLDEHEIELLVQFLMGLREEGIDPTMKQILTGDAKIAEQASRLMTEVNCVGCHRIGQVAQRVEFSEDLIDEGLEYDLWMARPLDVRGEQVLADHAWFTDLLYNPFEEEDYDTIDFFEEEGLEDTELMVYGHGEGDIGQLIEDKALRPPTLRGEGEKVNPDWLYDFLLKPYTVRNHLEVRMPTFEFTEDEARALTHWFSIRDQQDWPFPVDDDELDPSLLNAGYRLFGMGEGGYQCNQCHPSGDTLPTNPDKLNWGPDLTMAAERLKGDWITDWLLDPQQISPGTKMPNFFGEFAEGEYEVYVDDYEEEIAALRQYLKFMEQHMQEVSQN